MEINKDSTLHNFLLKKIPANKHTYIETNFNGSDIHKHQLFLTPSAITSQEPSDFAHLMTNVSVVAVATVLRATTKSGVPQQVREKRETRAGQHHVEVSHFLKC